tara:strand:- start:1752 stop:3893 length:2142 start_codon:yes stop_codon:yes gene_type:complete
MSITETDFPVDPHAFRVAQEGVSMLVTRLGRLASEQAQQKSLIEDRWVVDLRQYHGRYDPGVEEALKKDQKSRLFINETRSKTHSWEARLSDMLFPTDDVNWEIKPSPVPVLAGASRLIEGGTEDAAKLKEISELVLAKSAAMSAEIEDQFSEAQYALKCRQVIHDACKMGTGVIKGPFVAGKTRRRYEQVNKVGDDGQDVVSSGGRPNKIWQLKTVTDPRPGWERVDPFNYFPDMAARTPFEAEFHFERHLYTKKELRNLAKKPGFDKEGIREILRGEPRDKTPDYIPRLRDISDGPQPDRNNKYLVWEYHGPIEPDEVQALAIAQLAGLEQDDALSDLEEDPLTDREAVVWFSQDRVLMHGPSLLETDDAPYSSFSFEADDTSIFGYGVPYLLRDSQSAMNAAWRMMMDNAGLSVGPQIVISKNLVQPQDGVWKLAPRKIWLKTRELPFPTKAFETHHIDSRQVELANIIELAQKFADEETNMPMIAQGEQGTGTRNTGMGMSMLMNSVNVVFRRVVKNFDDYITVPNVQRQYTFNMMYSPKESIKGDFSPSARGSSVLLVRELQATNLLAIVERFSDHPKLGKMMKTNAFFRKLVQAHMLPSGELLFTDAELDQKAREEEQQPAPPDPEMLKLEMQYNIVEIESSTKIQIATMQQETAMISLAEKRNMTVEQLKTKLQVNRETNESSERKLATEVAVAARNPDKATGGSV